MLQDVNFDLEKQEILGLMGPSGSGKSILLKLIIGLMKPSQGEVWFQGKDLTRMTEHELAHVRAKIGYVFQEGALFDSLTIEENLSYPLRRHTEMKDQEIIDTVNMRLELLGLQNTNELYPGQISGGMRRRVGLLRATMLLPSLVLFDEPTSGLDPMNVENFVVQISRVRNDYGISGIFVTHDPAAAIALCDRIALLWEGRLRFVRVGEIMKSQDPIIRSFFKMHYDAEAHDHTA